MAKTIDSFARLCKRRTEPRDYRSRKCETASIINSNLAQGFELVGLGELADALQSLHVLFNFKHVLYC
jgi:sulfur relay (sulfurtransferase) complex TusBCD TusD component (DsrE family)